MANIGKSITIQGDLTGNEDLVVDGKVEGKIHLPSNELIIGPDGHVRAEVHAKKVTIIGRVAGNVSASDRIEIQSTGLVEGDVRAPRLAVQEGAVLNGTIDMGTKEARAEKPAPSPRPSAAASSAALPLSGS
jgi:cytoskeletal protein CcmA (bactofilin family)